jgi:hypothetical protein
MLTKQEIDTFQSQGYLLIRDFLCEEHVDICRLQALSMLHSHSPNQCSISRAVDQTMSSDLYLYGERQPDEMFFTGMSDVI